MTVDPGSLTEEQIAFQILLHAGNARSSVIAAVREYRVGNVDGYHAQIKQAEESLLKAHEVHSEFLQRDASGHKPEHVVLLMHAEDQLMAAQAMKDLVVELIKLFDDIKARDSNHEHE